MFIYISGSTVLHLAGQLLAAANHMSIFKYMLSYSPCLHADVPGIEISLSSSMGAALNSSFRANPVALQRLFCEMTNESAVVRACSEWFALCLVLLSSYDDNDDDLERQTSTTSHHQRQSYDISSPSLAQVLSPAASAPASSGSATTTATSSTPESTTCAQNDHTCSLGSPDTPFAGKDKDLQGGKFIEGNDDSKCLLTYEAKLALGAIVLARRLSRSPGSCLPAELRAALGLDDEMKALEFVITAIKAARRALGTDILKDGRQGDGGFGTASSHSVVFAGELMFERVIDAEYSCTTNGTRLDSGHGEVVTASPGSERGTRRTDGADIGRGTERSSTQRSDHRVKIPKPRTLLHLLTEDRDSGEDIATGRDVSPASLAWSPTSESSSSVKSAFDDSRDLRGGSSNPFAPLSGDATSPNTTSSGSTSRSGSGGAYSRSLSIGSSRADSDRTHRTGNSSEHSSSRYCSSSSPHALALDLHISGATENSLGTEMSGTDFMSTSDHARCISPRSPSTSLPSDPPTVRRSDLLAGYVQTPVDDGGSTSSTSSRFDFVPGAAVECFGGYRTGDNRADADNLDAETLRVKLTLLASCSPSATAAVTGPSDADIPALVDTNHADPRRSAKRLRGVASSSRDARCAQPSTETRRKKKKRIGEEQPVHPPSLSSASTRIQNEECLARWETFVGLVLVALEDGCGCSFCVIRGQAEQLAAKGALEHAVARASDVGDGPSAPSFEVATTFSPAVMHCRLLPRVMPTSVYGKMCSADGKELADRGVPNAAVRVEDGRETTATAATFSGNRRMASENLLLTLSRAVQQKSQQPGESDATKVSTAGRTTSNVQADDIIPEFVGGVPVVVATQGRARQEEDSGGDTCQGGADEIIVDTKLSCQQCIDDAALY